MNQFLGDKLRTTDIAGLNYDEFPNILDVKFLYNKRFKNTNDFVNY